MTKNLVLTEDGFSFADDRIGGWRRIGFSLNGRVCANGTVAGDTLRFADNGVEQTMHFDARDDALVVTRTLTHHGPKPFVIRDVSDGVFSAEASVGVVGLHEYNLAYLHSDNARAERYPDSRPEYPYLRQVPYAPVELGRGESNAWPALVICDLQSPHVLVEGDLDQRDSLRCWCIGMEGVGEKAWNDPLRTYQGRQIRPLATDWTVDPGDTATLSTVFYQLLGGVNPWEAYAAPNGYVAELERRHAFAVRRSPMRHGAVYCTWNYGTFHAIDEELLANRARVLAENVPGCTHFLIDDGYQQDRGNRNGPLDCFYPTPSERWDRAKFPAGMRAMAESLRDCGLAPCIWLSPTVYLASPLAEEHPDWLLCDADGDPALLGKSSFLDLSVPDARDFFLAVLDALFVDWGFQGVKFDFMTHWFTLEKARFRHGGSGPYWRDWVLGEIRRRIGEDGLLMTCIAMSMGNPFPGRNADCYRCGCDIHHGTWSEQVKACRATLPQVLLEGRKTFLLNMDSAGFGDIPENEQIFRLTWIFITQGIVELGGPVEAFSPRQFDLWRRLLAHCDRGHRVRCLDERAITGDGLPEMLRVDYPADSRMARQGIQAHLAFFNWQGHGKPIGADTRCLQLAPGATVTEYWSGELRTMPPDGLADFLPPHSARLWEVRTTT